MPEIDAVRVRVLLEQLCDLEPAWFWRTDSEGGIGIRSELGAGGAAYAVKTWADHAAAILEQRRSDEADCDLAEFAGMEFA